VCLGYCNPQRCVTQARSESRHDCCVPQSIGSKPEETQCQRSLFGHSSWSLFPELRAHPGFWSFDTRQSTVTSCLLFLTSFSCTLGYQLSCMPGSICCVVGAHAYVHMLGLACSLTDMRSQKTTDGSVKPISQLFLIYDRPTRWSSNGTEGNCHSVTKGSAHANSTP
jgi:hypothetical protein